MLTETSHQHSLLWQKMQTFALSRKSCVRIGNSHRSIESRHQKKPIVVHSRRFSMTRDSHCVPIMNNFSSLYFEVITLPWEPQLLSSLCVCTCVCMCVKACTWVHMCRNQRVLSSACLNYSPQYFFWNSMSYWTCWSPRKAKSQGFIWLHLSVLRLQAHTKAPSFLLALGILPSPALDPHNRQTGSESKWFWVLPTSQVGFRQTLPFTNMKWALSTYLRAKCNSSQNTEVGGW